MEASTAPRLKQIEGQVNFIGQRLAAVTEVYTNDRADLQSRIYEVEHTSSPRGKESLERDISKFEQKPRAVKLPALDGSGKFEKVSFTYPQLEEEFNRLGQEKARLLAQQAEILRPISELRKKHDDYVQEHLDGLTPAQLQGLKAKMESFSVEIRQINNPDAGLVDRCESCHVGIREPVVLTRKDVGGLKGPRVGGLHQSPRHGTATNP